MIFLFDWGKLHSIYQRVRLKKHNLIGIISLLQLLFELTSKQKYFFSALVFICVDDFF